MAFIYLKKQDKILFDVVYPQDSTQQLPLKNVVAVSKFLLNNVNGVNISVMSKDCYRICAKA